MTTFPKWLLFAVSVMILLTLIGGVTDGVLSSGSSMESQFESLMSGNPLALVRMMVWDFPWLDPPWDYLKLPLIAMWTVFGALLVYETAKFWRGI